ncbi:MULTISPECIES: DUF6680 family protein [Ralstonia solanacearum species complex]|nr:DUF6680 family protein [Ralstonia solanacearum]MDN4063902.1 hypothetical protein [Ralstonia solanacearum]NUU71277.1 hypothetical protein [Ralstonia solanacearum]QHB59572.1 hypothetical protein GRD98_11105 [Ralstonia solanacearum]
MTTAEWVIAFATLAGPVFAVQAQKWVERARAGHDRKVAVFTQLMATRGARVSADHVRALNMIDLAFYGNVRFGRKSRSNTEQAVLTAWKVYHDHLSDPNKRPPANLELVAAERDDLLADLLAAMATDLRFDFDRVQLKKSWYSPEVHGAVATQQLSLLVDASEVFSGRRALKVQPVAPQN